jgi:hypothetical protein
MTVERKVKNLVDYYVREGKIVVTAIDALRGRTRGSVNVCTVISASVVAVHFETIGGTATALPLSANSQL